MKKTVTVVALAVTVLSGGAADATSCHDGYDLVRTKHGWKCVPHPTTTTTTTEPAPTTTNVYPPQLPTTTTEAPTSTSTSSPTTTTDPGTPTTDAPSTTTAPSSTSTTLAEGGGSSTTSTPPGSSSPSTTTVPPSGTLPVTGASAEGRDILLKLATLLTAVGGFAILARRRKPALDEDISS